MNKEIGWKANKYETLAYLLLSITRYLKQEKNSAIKASLIAMCRQEKSLTVFDQDHKMFYCERGCFSDATRRQIFRASFIIWRHSQRLSKDPANRKNGNFL